MAPNTLISSKSAQAFLKLQPAVAMRITLTATQARPHRETGVRAISSAVFVIDNILVFQQKRVLGILENQHPSIRHGECLVAKSETHHNALECRSS
jgi:hypothetical protein